MSDHLVVREWIWGKSLPGNWVAACDEHNSAVAQLAAMTAALQEECEAGRELAGAIGRLQLELAISEAARERLRTDIRDAITTAFSSYADAVEFLERVLAEPTDGSLPSPTAAGAPKSPSSPPS